MRLPAKLVLAIYAAGIAYLLLWVPFSSMTTGSPEGRSVFIGYGLVWGDPTNLQAGIHRDSLVARFGTQPDIHRIALRLASWTAICFIPAIFTVGGKRAHLRVHSAAA